MFFTAFAMPLCDRELAVGYAHLFGPIAGLRAGLSPSPAITGAPRRPSPHDVVQRVLAPLCRMARRSPVAK